MKKIYYEEQYKVTKKEYEIYQKYSSKLSTMRLIAFLLLTILIILLRTTYFLWVSLIPFIGFIVLVVIHRKVSKKLLFLELKMKVLEEYLDRFNDSWQHFKDTGLEYLKMNTFSNGYVLSDLDIIGDASLYKFLCVAKTKKGKKNLIKALSNIEYTSDDLKKRQDAIYELFDNKEFCIEFQVALNEYDIEDEKGNIDYILDSMKKASNYPFWLLIANTLLSVFFFSSIILAMIRVVSISMVFVLFIFQFLLGMLYQQLNAETFSLIKETSKTLTLYTKMFETVSKEKFQSNLLTEIKKTTNNLDEKALKSLKRLKNLDSYRQNLLSALLFNGIIPFNALLAYYYDYFIKKYGELLTKAIIKISEMESLVSLAILPQVKENVTMPVMNNETVNLEFEELAHPLISEDRVVSNSFKTKDATTIITGSNMSGKTSFLRTIGINLILMNAGTFVNAKKFQASFVKIFTSMRITDDISHGISSFYREILRIKEAIFYAKKNQPMIALIDEVFRGTNSNDRITGAISMIKMLLKENVILIITTHDKELCEIKDEKVKNYHFSEYYQDDYIHFDYKLKEACLYNN